MQALDVGLFALQKLMAPAYDVLAAGEDAANH